MVEVAEQKKMNLYIKFDDKTKRICVGMEDQDTKKVMESWLELEDAEAFIDMFSLVLYKNYKYDSLIQ